MNFKDYSTVACESEADQLYEQFDGWNIETQFHGRYLVEDDNGVGWSISGDKRNKQMS